MKRGKSVDVHRGVEAIMVLVFFFSALMGCSLLKPSTKETSELPASSEVEQAGDLVLPSSAVRHASVCHSEKRADKERGLACAQLAEQHKRLARLFAAKRSGWKGLILTPTSTTDARAIFSMIATAIARPLMAFQVSSDARMSFGPTRKNAAKSKREGAWKIGLAATGD